MSGKGHVASGIVVALCLLTVRYGDRCAKVGTVAGLPDGAAPSPYLPPPGGAIPMPIPVEYTSVEAGADIPWSRVLHEVAPEVGLDLDDLAIDGLATTPATLNFVNFGRVHCPNIVDISADASGWNALKDGTGINCAPIVVLGFVGDDGRSMRHGGDEIPISWFAGECLLLGARCTFVACLDDACIADTHTSFRDVFKGHLGPYLREFLVRVVHQSAPPMLIAQPGSVDGKPIVALATMLPGPRRERMKARE
jgi:hypothetical protein